MKHALTLLAVGLMSVMCAQAQTATDLNEGQRVTTSATTGVFTLSWWGQAGRTYFIQQSFDLMTWQYVPVVMSGEAAVTGMNFSCSDSRQFWRLRYTDVYTQDAENDDFDFDGLSNQQELTLGLDPLNADMDGDALPDGWEVANGFDPKSVSGVNGAQGDPDGDLLTNLEEYDYGSNPRAADTDADTLSDYAEKYVHFTNPSLADSDNDGLNDAAEVLIYFTDPMSWDTDDDSLNDSAEVNTHLTNPLSKDGDNDGLNDGLNDDAEINTYQTNPNSSDSDNDGISDKSEIKQGTNANSASSRPAFESVEVVGDGAAGVRKTKQLTITLPQGERSYMVVIAAYSAEYPDWTGFQSEFDDVVDWKITPAGGTAIEGEKHVNELHGEWQQSETNGTTYLGLSPVAIAKIETIQGNASGTTSVQIELGAKNVSDDRLPSTLAAAILPVDIVPDESMYQQPLATLAPPLFLSAAVAGAAISPVGEGVLGDVVPSASTTGGEKHFVTPKKTTEIPDEYVVLKATGVTAEQITLGHANQIVEWHIDDSSAGSVDPNDPLKFRVKRDDKRHAVVSINTKGTTQATVKMHVWVVWCDSKLVGSFTLKSKVANQPPIGAVTTVSGGLQHSHTIQPPEIITAPEHPKLDGAKTKADGPPPAGATHPLYTSEKLQDGANNKWDASRQMRFKHSNPNGLPADAFSQPAPLITVTAFPTDPVEGNDDSNTGDEVPMPGGTPSGNANDPYQATSQGVLWSTDVPTFAISKGNFGETFEFNLQLQELPRLEINGKWYRIGDFKPWRMRIFMKKEHHPQLNIDYWNIDPGQSVIQSNHNDF